MDVATRASKQIQSDVSSYRPDVDGLRAFSILSVILFHFFPSRLPGGFIGVDVFFVISGYLISGLILKSLSAGEFSYLIFYARRIKRIFPALAVVLVASLAAGWFLLFSDEWRSLGGHTFAGAAFASNLALMREGGYFESTAKPLLHLWSLGVEEQFYIVWPLLLAFSFGRRFGPLQTIVVVLGASLVLSVVYATREPTIAFYFPAMRFWELALGALLNYLSFTVTSRRIATILSLVGALLLLASLTLIDENKPFPGAWALLPTVGAACMIAAGQASWINAKLLSSRVMVFFGLISYPLYLWHWPILVFTTLMSPSGMSDSLATGAIVASIALAYLTYVFVETPLRHHRSRLLVPIALVSVVGLAGIVGLAGRFGLFPARLHGAAGEQAMLQAVTDWSYPYGGNFKAHRYTAGEVHGKKPGAVLFIGDSHIEQYYSRVKALTDARPAEMPTTIFATHGGCPPLPRVNRLAVGFSCHTFYEYSMALAFREDVDTVVLGAFWPTYFGYGSAPNAEVLIHQIGTDRPRTNNPIELARSTMEELSESIALLRSKGKRVFVVVSVPTSGLFDPRKMVSRITGTLEGVQDVHLDGGQRSREVVDLLKRLATDAGAIIIDPELSLCENAVCKTTDDGVPIYRDGAHLRSSYAQRHATFIDQLYAD